MMNQENKAGLKAYIQSELNRRRQDRLRYVWEIHARPNQRVPEGDDWRVWLILAGRGFGKTRTGAETIRQWVDSGHYRRIALIGDNILNAQQIMVEGVSGLLQCYPPGKQPRYERSKQQIVWPNGAVAQIFSAEGYENLRGPQFDAAWIDEFAKFRAPERVWEQLMLSLRLGASPRCIVTTTPRPIRILTELMKQKDTVITRGSTFDNAANLSERFIATIKSQYANTQIAAQEVYGHIIDQLQGALWRRSMIRYQTI